MYRALNLEIGLSCMQCNNNLTFLTRPHSWLGLSNHFTFCRLILDLVTRDAETDILLSQPLHFEHIEPCIHEWITTHLPSEICHSLLVPLSLSLHVYWHMYFSLSILYWLVIHAKRCWIIYLGHAHLSSASCFHGSWPFGSQVAISSRNCEIGHTICHSHNI